MFHALAALALFISAAPAAVAACPVKPFQVGNVLMNAEGVVSRVVYVRQTMDSQNENAETKYIPVQRDRIQLERGDVIALNAVPTAVDASIHVEVRGNSQERDARGVFSTTYAVKKIHVPLFAGNTTAPPTIQTFLVKVKGNYIGDGKYSRRDCGSIEVTEIN